MFWTIDELAAVLKVSKLTVRKLWYTAKIPPPVRIGGRIRWCKADIEKWAAAGCPAIEPEPERIEA